MSAGTPDGSQGGFRVPVQVERVLARAAQDPDFLRALQERGSAAAVDAGFSLRDAERAVLDAATPDQLEAMARSLPSEATGGIPGPDPGAQLVTGIRPDLTRGTRPLLPLALAATGAVLVGGAAAGMLIVTGSRPDEPEMLEPPVPYEADDDAGPPQDDAGDAEARDGASDADAATDGARRK